MHLVHETKLVAVKNVAAAFQSEEYDWATLVTREFYNPFTGDYLFPWYNNIGLNSQLRIGNDSGASTDVTISIGGTVMETVTIADGASYQVKYTGVNDGPVSVVSSGADIAVAMRVIYEQGGLKVSYSELMGYPSDQLHSEYLFPWYNNVGLNSQLRIGYP